MKTTDWQLQRTFYLLGSLVLVGSLLYWGRPILIPVTLAILLTFVLGPIAGRVERWRIPRFIACSAVVLGAAVLVVGIVHVFTLQVRSLAAEVPEYQTQIKEKIGKLREATTESWIANVVEFTNGLIDHPAEGAVEGQKGESPVARMNIPLMAILQSVAGTAAEILFNAVLVLVLTLLMLMRREDLRSRLIHLLGPDNMVSTTRTMDDANKRISRFLFSQLILNLAFGVVVTCGLYLIGIPYAYVWGAMAALLRYIPFLGGWLAAAFPLLASLVLPNWIPFFLTAAFFVIIELLQANLVEPQVYGHSIGVSGVSQLIAMLFWGCLWGPVGLIVSTPLTACVCVLGRHFSGLRFLSTLIGDEEIVEKPAAFYQRLVAGDTVEAAELAEEFIKENGVATVYDTLILPALLSAENDQRQGDLAREDHLTIIDAVREVFLETIAPREIENRSASASDGAAGRILVVNLPFQDETDEFVAEMMKNTSLSTHWSFSPARDVQAGKGAVPTLVYLATAREKNLVRLRGVCKSMRDLFPNAAILVACWSADDGIDQMVKRLKDAGATAVCTSFVQARQVIEQSRTERDEKPHAVAG